MGLQMIQAVIRKYLIEPERIAQFSSDSGCVYKQHIMHTLFEADYSLSIYEELYEKLFDRGGIGCVLISYPDVERCIKGDSRCWRDCGHCASYVVSQHRFIDGAN